MRGGLGEEEKLFSSEATCKTCFNSEVEVENCYESVKQPFLYAFFPLLLNNVLRD